MGLRLVSNDPQEFSSFSSCNLEKAVGFIKVSFRGMIKKPGGMALKGGRQMSCGNCDEFSRPS